MITPCQPLSRSLAEEMLQIAARAICDRPRESPEQRASRTRQLVHSVLGFEPRDGLEYMLSTMTVGHFHLLLDSMYDAFHSQVDLFKAKTRTTIVALGRAMLAMIKELRLLRRRPVAQSADDARREQSVEWAPDRPMPAPPNKTKVSPLTPDAPAQAASAPVAPAQAAPAQAAPAQAAPASGPPESATANTSAASFAPAQPEPAVPVMQATGMQVPGAVSPSPSAAPLQAGDPDPGAVEAWLHTGVSEEEHQPSSGATGRAWTDQDEAALIERMAAFEILLATANGRPEEAPTEERATVALANAG